MARKLAFLVACVLAALVLTVPAPAWAYSNTPPTAIYVNGEDITVDYDHRIACGEGFAVWDSKTGVLTLDDATITETYFNAGGSSGAGQQGIDSNCGIYTGNEVDLVIELVGSNTITAGVQTWGFGSGGSITIQGEGSLEVVSNKTLGITAYRDLTIDGATVRASSSANNALHSNIGSVRIVGGAKVEATSGGSSSYAIGVAQPSSATVDTNLVVSGQGTYLKAVNAKEAVEGDFPTLYAANNLVFEDGAVIEVDGTVVANNDVTIQSGAKLSASNEDGSYALYAVGALTIDGASVSASSVGGYGIVTRENLSVHDAVIDARSTDSNGLRVIAGGATIDGGTIALTSENHAALSTADTASITGGVVTLKGASSGALTVTGLDFGGKNWYQWATSSTGAVTKSEDVAYDSAGRTDTYLRIEPVGTTYDLTVSGGEGTGSYVAGMQVTISADAFSASGHFSEWVLSSDPTGAGLLADSSARETTFTMPAGTVELTAIYEPHAALEHVAAVDSTCTSEGAVEYWTCSECGALFSDSAGTTLVSSDSLSVPALGHDYVDGVCAVCGEKDPDYVAPEEPEKNDATIPATGDASVLFSLVPALLGGSVLAGGLLARRHRG